jgi:hypothetical protein
MNQTAFAIAQRLRGLEKALNHTLTLNISEDERTNLTARRGIYEGIAEDIERDYGVKYCAGVTPSSCPQEAWKCPRAHMVGGACSECGWCYACAKKGPDAWKDEDDKPLPEDPEIHAAFPTRSGRHDLYATAMRLVGARYSKGGLVALVVWLLLKGEKNVERLRTMFLECFACKASLQEPTEPPHCIDCSITEEQHHAWEEFLHPGKERTRHADACASFDFDPEQQLGPDKPCNCGFEK